MRPGREQVRSNECAYFVSTQTFERRSLFQVEKWARLMVDVLKHYDGNGYALHAFVVMPDHLHVLLSPGESIEKAVQLIKGGFSFRAKRELGWGGEVWQPGFTDHRIRDSEDWERHLEYIRLNPVEARLVEESVLYEWMGFPNICFPQGLKPRLVEAGDVRAEARTLPLKQAVVEMPRDRIEAQGIQENACGGFPQGLKPRLVEAGDVRAEARTLPLKQAKGQRQQGAPEAAPFQSKKVSDVEDATQK